MSTIKSKQFKPWVASFNGIHNYRKSMALYALLWVRDCRGTGVMQAMYSNSGKTPGVSADKLACLIGVKPASMRVYLTRWYHWGLVNRHGNWQYRYPHHYYSISARGEEWLRKWWDALLTAHPHFQRHMRLRLNKYAAGKLKNTRLTTVTPDGMRPV